jgi:CDP-diacylglycerol---serine O-phosphatidyltransferase
VREHVRPANVVTSLNLAAGFAALLALPRYPLLALGLVLLAAVFDVLDGVLARRAGGTAFGAQLDSLADLFSFCVVPAYALGVTAGGPPGAAVGAAFLIAGAWRLARFPLVKQQDHFVGLPTPAAGALLLALALWAPGPVALAGGAVLAVLMVGTVRFPSFFTAAATVRHPREHGRRTLNRVRAVRPRVLPRRRPRTGAPAGHADLNRRRRAAARARRLLHAVRRRR